MSSIRKPEATLYESVGDTDFIWKEYPPQALSRVFIHLEGDPGFAPSLFLDGLNDNKTASLTVLSKFQNIDSFNTLKHFNLPGWKGNIIFNSDDEWDLVLTIPNWPPMPLDPSAGSSWIYSYPLVRDFCEYFSTRIPAKELYFISTTAPNEHFHDIAFKNISPDLLYDITFHPNGDRVSRVLDYSDDSVMSLDDYDEDLFLITPQWLFPHLWSETTIKLGHLLLVGSDANCEHIDEAALKTLEQHFKNELGIESDPEHRKQLLAELELARTAEQQRRDFISEARAKVANNNPQVMYQ